MNNNNNINNTEKKTSGIINQNNAFLNSYYRTPNKTDTNSIYNNRNANLSNNKIYSIVDTKENKNQQNYEDLSKNNNNIYQNQNININNNQILDDLFDD